MDAPPADTQVDAGDVAQALHQQTGIPMGQIAGQEQDRLARMEEILHQRVVGQDAAISALARAVRRARAGLKDPKRPIGSFLFLGPSGVGKTESALALAEFLFGTEDAVITLNMSEYMEKHNVARLIGAPPGYVGYDEGGQLTEAVRRGPTPSSWSMRWRRPTRTSTTSSSRCSIRGSCRTAGGGWSPSATP